jgi:predicted transposase YbfD/YdcC
LAGAQCFTEIEDFCEIHEDFLRQYFPLPNGIPSHDTFSRVFAALAPKTFESCFLEFLNEILELFPEGVIAIDGKSIRASRRVKDNLKALHIVSAWSCSNGMSLGQMIVDGKTNEITAVPILLEKLCLSGAIVTLDAMGCQKAIAEKIIEGHGDYLLRVKGNQGGLLEAIEDTFIAGAQLDYKSMVLYSATDEVNHDHGRLENRSCIVLPAMYLLKIKLPWKGIRSLICVTSERESLQEHSKELRYYISSLDPKDPEKILKSIRSHWQIENHLHWALDVSYREDQCRIRDENSALNMAWLRKTALALLKRTGTLKGSIRRKQLALWAHPSKIIDLLRN